MITRKAFLMVSRHGIGVATCFSQSPIMECSEQNRTEPVQVHMNHQNNSEQPDPPEAVCVWCGGVWWCVVVCGAGMVCGF